MVGSLSCGCKTSPNHQPSTTVLGVCFWLNVAMCVTAKHQILFQESSGSFGFHLWQRVDINLNAPEQRTDRDSAFIEVLTLADDQLIKYFDWYYHANTYPLISHGSSKNALHCQIKNEMCCC